MSDDHILRKHKLAHIRELRVSQELLSARFAAHCSMSNCRGKCCSDGVDLDPAERDKILDHAALIRSRMDGDQEQAPEKWFTESFEEGDFPSGRAVSTRTHNGGCVFLNNQGLCVLHAIETQPDNAVGVLKPFYCRAYPVCIAFGVLTIDEEECTGEFQCCNTVAGGPLTIFDLCDFELEHVLGKEGASELRALADAADPKDETVREG